MLANELASSLNSKLIKRGQTNFSFNPDPMDIRIDVENAENKS